MSSTLYTRFYAVVRRIPRGRVASYGQVARLAGLPRYARHVGYAMHALPSNTTVPWHRVVNAQGGISKRAIPDDGLVQRELLEAEGVRFTLAGRVTPEMFWTGETQRNTTKKTGQKAAARKAKPRTTPKRSRSPTARTSTVSTIRRRTSRQS